MERRSPGILLSLKPHGEAQALATVFTLDFGCIRGLMRGGRKTFAGMQAGAIVSVTQRKRLEHQLGNITIEVKQSAAAKVMHDYGRLQVLSYICDAIMLLLPEDNPQPMFYDRTRIFLEKIAHEGIWERLAYWEVDLLHAIGYAMRLDEEESVRNQDDKSPLLYVSPRSGRAVSAQAGAPYKEKLLTLPTFFGGQEGGFLDVFRLTGHFLEHALEEMAPRRKLSARASMLDWATETGFKA